MTILAAMGDPAADAWLDGRNTQAFTPYTLATEALRAELQRFRRQGWALMEQQQELNCRGVALPLLDRNHEVHGAISITMPINQEQTADAVARVLPVLQEAARGLRALI